MHIINAQDIGIKFMLKLLMGFVLYHDNDVLMGRKMI